MIAAPKDHNGITWALGGFLFGPMALIAATGLPVRKLRKKIGLPAEQQGVSPEAFAPKSEKEKKSHPTTPEFTATPLR